MDHLEQLDSLEDVIGNAGVGYPAQDVLPMSLYNTFSRAEWSRLRADTPMTLSETEFLQLRGHNENLALSEVEDIYLPLSRLLNFYVAAVQNLHTATAAFLGKTMAKENVIT